MPGEGHDDNDDDDDCCGHFHKGGDYDESYCLFQQACLAGNLAEDARRGYSLLIITYSNSKRV